MAFWVSVAAVAAVLWAGAGLGASAWMERLASDREHFLTTLTEMGAFRVFQAWPAAPFPAISWTMGPLLLALAAMIAHEMEVEGHAIQIILFDDELSQGDFFVQCTCGFRQHEEGGGEDAAIRAARFHYGCVERGQFTRQLPSPRFEAVEDEPGLWHSISAYIGPE